MQKLSRLIVMVMLVVLGGEPLSAIPAFAQESGTVTGTVVDQTATPVAGATVTLIGLGGATAKTDADGHYSLSVPAGLYRLLVRAPGFSDTTDDSVAVTSAGLTLDARLERPSLSSLQTIGVVRSTGAGQLQFNTTPMSKVTIGAQVFADQGDIGVRAILDQTPGIIASSSSASANGGVRGAINYPTIRGGLSYETASLIDGHPVSVGKFGDYVTTFLNSYMFQSIEVQKGPGSMPQQISRSVNGTVNFRTWDPSPHLTGNLTYGLDAFGGSFSNIRVSDTFLNGKIGFVFAYATEGTPGPAGNSNPSAYTAALTNVSYTDSNGVPIAVGGVVGSRPPGAANTTNTLQTTSTIACCVPIPTYFLNRMQLGKLRFNFSDVTSFTAAVIASQTTASQNGNVQNLQNVNFNPATPNATVASGHQFAFFPFNDNFAYDYEFNNEPIFTGEFHTQIKNDNISARFYSASIGRLQTNNDPGNLPFTIPVNLYGTTTTGAPLNGLDPYGKPYLATITNPLFTTNEQDNLLGYTFQYAHALGNTGNTISFTADNNYSWTHVYTPGMPDTSASTNIPAGSVQTIRTYSVRGDFQIGSKLNVTASYYLSNYDTHYPIFSGAAAPFTINFSDNVFWHNDVRLGLAYRLDHDTSLRFALGSAVVPPFMGIYAATSNIPSLCTAATCPAGIQPGAAYVSTQGAGGNLLPETSFGYDIGGDYRFGPGWPDTVLSGDVYLTNLQNQFLKSVFLNGTFGPAGMTLPLYTTGYSNLSASRYEGLELTLNHAPPVGIGYTVQGALLRGYPYNVSPSIYQFNAAGVATTNQGVVAGANFGPTTLLSSGGSAIPYSQAYAEISYRLLQGWYANLGTIYYGPNNTFNEPAFMVFRSTLRVPVYRRNTYIQFSVDNLFNTHSQIFDVTGSGIPAPAINGQFITTPQKGYGPQNFHLSLVHVQK